MSDPPDTRPEEPSCRPSTIEAVWIDREAGSGSLDKTDVWSETIADEYGYANDGRSSTRTTFYWRSDDKTPHHLRNRDRHQKHRDPDDRRDWSELAKWNDGKGSPSRRQDNFNADVRRWTETFCDHLGLLGYETERVHYVVDTIDLDEYGTIPSESIILAVISLVVDAETTADPDEWTVDDWIIYREDFEELMDDVDMDRGVLWTVRKRVHTNSDLFETNLES